MFKIKLPGKEHKPTKGEIEALLDLAISNSKRLATEPKVCNFCKKNKATTEKSKLGIEYSFPICKDCMDKHEEAK